MFGNGSFALTAYHTFKHDNGLEISAFTVDRSYIKENQFLGIPLVPFDEVIKKYPPSEYSMLIALGFLKTNQLRAQKYNEIVEIGYNLRTLVNKKAITYPELKIGNNCFIAAGVVIHPGAEIGNNVVIRESCFIGHHSVIEDHCFIGAGSVVAGGTTIGAYSILGINSSIRDGVTIAKSCIIGAGVTVLQDTNEKEVFISNTAQKFPFSSDNF